MLQSDLKEKEITVQQLNRGGAPKFYGSLKTSEGEFFGIQNDMLMKFTEGEVCKIAYTETPRRDGNGVWLNLKRKLTTQAPSQIKPPPPPTRATTSRSDSEQIFVTALLKEIVNINISEDKAEAIRLVNFWRSVWQETFGGKDKIQSGKPNGEEKKEEPFNDEIPY